jgi:hypothetical protein
MPSFLRKQESSGINLSLDASSAGTTSNPAAEKSGDAILCNPLLDTIERALHAPPTLVHDMGVDHRCGYVRMSKQFLHCAYVVRKSAATMSTPGTFLARMTWSVCSPIWGLAEVRSNRALENGRSQASLRSLARAVQRGR